MKAIKEKLIKYKKHFIAKLYICRHEHVSDEGVKYLFVNKNTEDLLIVFSGFTGEKRRYNYFLSFADLKISQLYIMDTWGFMGSYYWYENGDSYPEEKVLKLIKSIIDKNGISSILTAGTSKGGTAALYYGLKLNASNVYAGSCQYYVGNYLNVEEHRNILSKMMGDAHVDSGVCVLNEKMETAIVEHSSNEVTVHLFYSINELTYKNDIIPLVEALKKSGIKYTTEESAFMNHNEVGNYFPDYLLSTITKRYLGN